MRHTGRRILREKPLGPLTTTRRVNDYATAVRIFEGISEKVENKQQYQQYLDELKGVREELGKSSLSVGYLDRSDF